VDGGISILQYTDESILFLDHGVAKAANLKILLFALKQASGLKIICHKSEFFVLAYQRRKRIVISLCLDVEKVATPSNILESTCIFGD
jgi:hypothetical protein